MSWKFSEINLSKLTLPLLSAALIGQFLLLNKNIWWRGWLFWLFLVLVTFIADITAQVRKKSEAPLSLFGVVFLIALVMANVILVTYYKLKFTWSNLFYVKGEHLSLIVLILAFYWGLSHGEMLSSIKAYWHPLDNEIADLRIKAFTPISMSLIIKRTLFLGFVEHLIVWQFNINLVVLLPFWLLQFTYLSLIQFWGLAINLKGMKIDFPKGHRGVWQKSLIAFFLIVIIFSWFMPRNILTIRSERIANNIVNLLSKIHSYQAPEREKPRSIPFLGNEQLEDNFSPGKPTATGWLFITFFVLQLIIVVLLPALTIATFIGWLLYLAVKSEYDKLEGLPGFFINIYLWLKNVVVQSGKKVVLITGKENPGNILLTRAVEKKYIFGHSGCYKRLIKVCQNNGLQFRASMTPNELAKASEDRWPQLKEKVLQITSTHIEEKYGKIKLSKKKKKTCWRNLEQITAYLQLWQIEKEIKKQEIPRI